MWSTPIEMTRDEAPEGVPATAMPWRGAIKLTAPEPGRDDHARALAGLPRVRQPPAHRRAHADARAVRPATSATPSTWAGSLDPARSSVDTTGLRRVGARRPPRGRHRARPTCAGVGDLTLSFPELRQYSVLLISRDVGIPVVLAAAILVLVGLIPALYVSRRKVWVRAEAAPGGALVKIGGFALQRKDVVRRGVRSDRASRRRAARRRSRTRRRGWGRRERWARSRAPRST